MVLVFLSGSLVSADLVNDWRVKGNNYWGAGQYTEALAAYEQAIALEPMNPEFWQKKASLLFELGRFEETIDACDQFLAIVPQNDVTSKLKGDALFRLNRYEEAVDAYNDAIDFFPENPGTYVAKGDSLYELGRFEEALAAYQEALARDPGNTEAQYGISRVETQPEFLATVQTGEESTRDPGVQPGEEGTAGTDILPDLTITKLSMKQKDDVIAGTLTIANKGVDAGKCIIEYFLTDTYYPDKVGGNVTSLGTDSVNYLGSGEERDASDIKMFTIPSTLPPGTYWAGAYIDSLQVIDESDETNNVMYDTGMVEIEE